MKFILAILFFLTACSDTLVPDDNKGATNGGDNVDYCEVFGWYNDGRCDKDCSKPDPDCSDACERNPDVQYDQFGSCEVIDFSCVGNQTWYQDECGCACIKPEVCELNPNVDYVAFGAQCNDIDFDCLGKGGDYQIYQDECGCGCIPRELQCTYEDPNIQWFSTDPEICTQDIYRPDCPVNTFHFENDCGCGCSPLLSCESDIDCRRGFCELQAEDPICVFNRCGDGSEALCDVLPPYCPAGQVPEVKDGCWGPCVSARTCQFVCRNDNDCLSQNRGRVCIVPECPSIEGAVCENFCAAIAG